MVVMPCIHANSTLEIEVLPPQPVSGQNFTVSVYDSTIVNETPYLTDVIIEFENTTYQITDRLPNRELELTAPLVYVPTSFTITASKQTYNSTNKTITVQPSSDSTPHLVITLLSEQLNAGEIFTLKITDEFNNPIANATVSIQHQQNKQTDGVTNESGIIRLRAPNQSKITIIAQKEHYLEDTTTFWVQTKQDTTTAFLSHPYVPIGIAVSILIFTIVFVTLKNRTHRVNYHLLPKNTKNRIHHQQEKKIHVMKKEKNFQKSSTTTIQYQVDHSPKVEEITITQLRSENNKPKEPKKDNTLPSKKTKHHQWFSNEDTIEHKVDQLLSEQSSNKKDAEWFQGTSKLKDAIDNTIKRKHQKEKSKST
jgi:hypothetical protein